MLSDVILGRGNNIGKLPGNVNFRRVCWKFKPVYLRSYREEKQPIAEKVIETIARLSPPGRFLEQAEDEDHYVLVDRKKAIEKVCQLLREKKVTKPKGMDPLPKSQLGQDAPSRRSVRKPKKSSKPLETLEDDSASVSEAPVTKGKSVKAKKAARRSAKFKREPMSKKIPFKPKEDDPDYVDKPERKKKQKKKAATPTKKPQVIETVSKTSNGKKIKKPKATTPVAVDHWTKPTAAKAKKTPTKPGKSVYQRTYAKNPRRSICRVMAKPAKEYEQVYKAKKEESSPQVKEEKEPSLSTVQTVKEEKEEALPSHPVTPTSGPESHSAPVMAFEEDEEEVEPFIPDTFVVMETPPLRSADEFLRNLKAASSEGGIAFGDEDDYDDTFDKEIEAIAPPPFPLRGDSSWSFHSGFALEPSKQRKSPSGVAEIPLPPALQMQNSLFVEGIESAFIGAAVSKDIFEKDTTAVEHSTTNHKLWY